MSERRLVAGTLDDVVKWWDSLKKEAEERREREQRTLKMILERQAKLDRRLLRLESLNIGRRLEELRAEVDGITAELRYAAELDELAEESGIL